MGGWIDGWMGGHTLMHTTSHGVFYWMVMITNFSIQEFSAK